jgi:peptide/nickel transport system substrate-binding protein
MLSQLVRVSASDHSAIASDLAAEWGVSEDGTEWRFGLREDVKWHDGAALSADDVVFSLRRAIDPPAGITIGRADAIARYVSAPEQVREDEGDVFIKTDYPAASFLPNLASVYLSIYPRAATEVLDPPSMTAFTSVIGTGPFKAGTAVRGSRYELERNDGYYEPGLPYLDGVEFLVMPEPAVRMAALRDGQIDTIAIITGAEAEGLEQDLAGQVTVFTSPSAGGNTVQMNLRQPPFDDPRVRRAVNLAISRRDAELALGAGFTGAVLPPGSEFAMDSAEALTLPGYGDVEANRKEARRLLAEAGFQNGFSTTLYTRANSFFLTLSEFAAGQLATVGIKATVESVEPVAYQEMIMSGDFGIIGHSHSFALDDPDSVLPSNYSCGGSENFPGLCDPALDAMIAAQSRELDPDRRLALLNQIERTIWEYDAKVWFQWSSRRTPVRSDVRGLEPGGPSLYQGRRLERVYFDRGG